ncbi:TonB-dependent receptor [Sphingobium sp. CR2-8]|uniref:TonB-dependent receptor plug domain-containing protein n=1 Tax=Sphingobium sp. CR2-8 TaxID=1306534 RepID=UPI002DBC0953|nr:TonB-dependent receptor [Sphingobium sp. CR2-8]MEC3909753.1 TonB-dependent receptor [Sphingobium sp. CR2-8]
MKISAFMTRVSRTALLSGVATIVAIPLAAAQTVPDPATQAVVEQPGTVAEEATPQANNAPDIIVTGSRIGRSGFTTPTPVTVLSADQLTKAAPSTIADSLRTLPALTATSGPQRASGTQGGGQSFLNLRNLGAVRTLTLLDGRRFVAASQFGTVDVNLLPAGLIQRVDVVTGGASAAYGSDAVAGVVNFVLDTRFEGLKGEISSGIADAGDNQELRGTLTGGLALADNRLHLLASAEYYRNKGILEGERDWARRGSNLINGPAGGPALIGAEDVRAIGSYGGLITTGNGGTAAQNAMFRALQFGPGGTVLPYSYGSYSTATQQIGGDGVNTELLQEINRPLERAAFFGRAEYDLTDKWSIFGEASYGTTNTRYSTSTNRHLATNLITIRRDNAFLPAQLRTMLAANPQVTSLSMIRWSIEGGLTDVSVDTKTDRYVAGFKGELAGLKVNGYYQHGRTKQQTDVINNEITPNFTRAVDAVVNPANGQIVCRSTLTNPNDGCAPFNVFGVGSPSAAALAYTRGVSRTDSTFKEDVAAINISGTLFEGWAGPISFATGGEYRKEQAQLSVDALSQAGAFLFANPQPWAGSYDVKEGYVETVIPLLKDQPFARDLEFNGAVRYTDYSTSGGVTTWKAGLSWTPISALRLRATRSRDIRAPNLSELFTSGRTQSATVVDPFRNNIRTSGIFITTTGNANLQPEKADTLTLGAVLQPAFIPGFSISADYYDIKINDAIGSLSAQQGVDQCFAGNQLACGFIQRDAAGNISALTAYPINLSTLETNGVDVELSYRVPLADDATSLSLRSVISYVGKLATTTPGSPSIDRAGEVGINANPHWRFNAQADFNRGNFNFFNQVRFIGGGRYDNTKGPAAVDLQDIKAQAYWDMRFAYKFEQLGKGAELYLNVQNVLDQDPPFAPGDGSIAVATNTQLYDTFGRIYRVGFRFKF